jgi:hypothetical protein
MSKAVEERKISPEEEKEMMDMLMKRLKMSPEFVEARNKLKFGKTVAEKLEALNLERRIILQGGSPWTCGIGLMRLVLTSARSGAGGTEL